MTFEVAQSMSLAGSFIVGFMLCWLVALIGFVKAYSNFQPGINWLNFASISIRERQKHPEEIFSPKGLFWLRIAKFAVVAGFAFGLLQMAATELLR